MNKILLFHRTFWTVVLAVTLAEVTVQPALVWAQTLPSPASLEPLIFNSSNQTAGFENTGRPANQTSTGSRSPDSCIGRLIALVPGSEPLPTSTDNHSSSESLLALTVNNMPTFWFYLSPELADCAASAKFVLMSEDQRPIYREQISLNSEAGVIGIRPAHSLAADQVYRWVFQLEVTGEPGLDPAVEGFVKYIQPDSTLSQQLTAAASPQERVRVYASHGIWHDALTEVASLRLEDAALQSDWASLLDSVGLGAIANSPLLNCCISQPVAD